MTFFDSKWVEQPSHVKETSGLPAGFRAGGVACGIKQSGKLDLGLLVCDSENAVSAARFTRSGVLAAPVLVCQERCELNDLRAVIANSGNANAATGAQGIQAAVRMQVAAAEALEVSAAQVAVASTGVIGVHLDANKIESGAPTCAGSLSQDGDGDFAEAIRTTDAFPKLGSLEVDLGDGRTVRLAAQCKGAGMIRPGFATLLCFVETDAALSPETADLLLGVTADRSFERISVDGQLSTNDTLILIASGASGVTIEPQTEAEARFGEALDALLRQLALLVLRDGEGATRVGRVVVSGGHEGNAEAAARAVATSPLVQTALNGADPNWGRIAQALGAALPGTAPLPFDIAIEGVQVCAAGEALEFDHDALVKAVSAKEVEYAVTLPGDGAEAEVFFSDLGHGYITINAEYTT